VVLRQWGSDKPNLLFLGGELVGCEAPWWQDDRIPNKAGIFCVSFTRIAQMQHFTADGFL